MPACIHGQSTLRDPNERQEKSPHGEFKIHDNKRTRKLMRKRGREGSASPQAKAGMQEKVLVCRH